MHAEISAKYEKEKMYVIYADFLEFFTAKFNICSTFLSRSYRLKIKKKLSSLLKFWNKIFMPYLEQK